MFDIYLASKIHAPMKKAYLYSALAGTILFSYCQKNNSYTPQPPSVTIDTSGHIQLPVDSATLTGIATPKGGATIAGYIWSQVSGPNAALFTDDGSAVTSVKGLVAGTYIFQLSATDSKGFTGTALDTLIVNPATLVTLTLTPSNNSNEVELWGYNSQDMGTNPISNELGAEYWTVSGNPIIGRGLFQFDLSSIPANATILSASLSLYSDSIPSNGDLIHANYGADDSMVIRQVTSSWSATSVNWNTQPSVTNNNQVLIPATTVATLNLTLNVTPMVANMVSSSSNYGFELGLQNESILFTSRTFCSSKFSEANRHPSLVIQYSVSQ